MLTIKEQIDEPLITLKAALDGVETKYIEINYNRVRRGVQKPETSFVAELYHQIRKLQENTGIFPNLMIHVDISKSNYPILENECLKGLNTNRMRPDLVVHTSQNKNTDQNLICEIKIGKDLGLLEISNDLKKLLYYKFSLLRFLNAVFIFYGSKEYFENILRQIILVNPALERCLCENQIIFCLPKENKKKTRTREWEFYAIENCNEKELNSINK